jgi:hypothetical protein
MVTQLENKPFFRHLNQFSTARFDCSGVCPNPLESWNFGKPGAILQLLIGQTLESFIDVFDRHGAITEVMPAVNNGAHQVGIVDHQECACAARFRYGLVFSGSLAAAPALYSGVRAWHGLAGRIKLQLSGLGGDVQACGGIALWRRDRTGPTTRTAFCAGMAADIFESYVM